MAESLNAKQLQAKISAKETGRYSIGEGLYLMIPKSGKPYWMLRYTFNSKRKEMTIAKHGELSLKEAKAEAALLRKKLLEGINPLAERKKEQATVIKTVDDLFEDWYKTLEPRLQHPNIPKRIYQKEMSPYIGQQSLKHISPLDIRDIVQRVANSGRPTIANDTLMYAKQLFRHGVKFQLLDSNPALALEITDAGGVEKSRSRFLTLKEIDQVFTVFGENKDSFTRENYLACTLLLCLGVRKAELTEAKWDEFDLDKALWHLPSDRSKSGNGFIVPLPEQVVEWFRELHTRACGSEYVFPNRRASKVPHMGKDTLNRAIAKLFGREPGRKIQPPNKMGDIEYFTVHDLRRTCRSLLASAGVPSHIAERCLNHKLKGVEGIYDRHDYLDERREALNKLVALVRNSITQTHHVS
ncbi:tyrosine-type recombinase/integrase [Vibrio parahaemolyticus]|uniref:tyrosine-type recombinase/integrase n=1 Tax=Vibrio parahaemolyticus TaxID=670 RepID=UPI0004D73583|nr:site-specific integrase [Vibrio parahaemolyticus]EJG0618037.1 tyrosine-type recombinase/integrase [Vibrio parahaemolyticus]EJG0636259.1 tyrosine-type recombinase/integrase [Vibrio parahaemolyticus]EJG0685601.1 tyrosine-type recombinase/integrase [Vibrio parahaemolyticus]EJG0699000.1 tyrosine-type recombinase/integrase [Vibrio parahaemolyticus]EJG0726309.1 tyrosine-type recombinase/integrase [Vibrio parahaemolyticus]